MRSRSCLVGRRRGYTARFGFGTALLGVSILSVFLALGGYAWALLVFLTALLHVVVDRAATAMHRKGERGGNPDVSIIRRFWHRSSVSPTGEWLTPDPIVLATVYIAVFQIWHLFLFMLNDFDGVRRLFDLTNGIGVSLRAMEHAVNALVLLHLIVHLAGSLLPHAAAQPYRRIPIVVAIVIVAAMHFVIF